MSGAATHADHPKPSCDGSHNTNVTPPYQYITPRDACDGTRVHVIRNHRALIPGAQADGMALPQSVHQLQVSPQGLVMRTRGYVNATPVIVLNDTGATVTVMREALAAKLQLDVLPATVGTTVNNPNGEPFEMTGVVTDTVSFEGVQFPFTAHVLRDLQVDFILGQDFLMKHNVYLSYGDAEITYAGVRVPVIDRPCYTARRYRRTDGSAVYAGEDVCIAPGAVQDIFAVVKMRAGLPCAQYAWRFQPLQATQDTLDVTMADGIVRIEGSSDVIVRITNMRTDGKDVVVPAGTMLGTLRTLRTTQDDHTRPMLVAIETRSNEQHTEIAAVPPQVTVQADQVEDRDMAFRKLLDGIVAGLPEELSTAERDQLRSLLTEYRDTVYSERIGRANAYVFDINPGTARPVCHPDRRWSPQEMTYIKAHIEQLLQQGLIEPSNSPWSSRLVCAPKKDASGMKTDIRVCVDFRDVNALTYRDAYPAPNIFGVLDRLHGMTYFTSMDLQKGFHQIDMTERARDICSFRCPFGFYRYTKLPFGVMNAPAAFQRMMDTVLRGLIHGDVMVYMDDVIIFTKDWQQHMERLREVLRRVADAGLTIQLKKCTFGRHSLLYLGHIVSKEGIKPDGVKVEAVRSVQQPTNLTELQTFLGLTGVFRRFVAGYGDMARPLAEMTRKSEQSKWRTGEMWTQERIHAMNALKDAICDEVTLAHPRFDRPLLMVCDASDYGMGAMLAQIDDEGRERPIAFTSATFTGPARNYTTTEKEGLSVAWAAAQFRPYIHGIPTVVVTDHAALTHILRKGVAPQRIARIVLDLAEYDLTYVHRKGSHNKVADAMSRLTSVMSTTNTVVGSPGDFASPPVVNALARDDAMRHLQKTLAVDVTAPTDVSMGDGTYVTVTPAGADAGMAPTSTPRRGDGDHCGATSTPRLGDNHRTVTMAKVRGRVKANKSAPIYVAPDASPEIVLPVEVTVEAFAAAQHADPECESMFRYLTTEEEPKDRKLCRWVLARSDEFVVQESLLKHVEITRDAATRKTVRVTTYVPKALRGNVLRACHDHMATGGHMGIERTYLRVRQYYWWPRLYGDVRDYVTACLTCQTSQGHARKQALLQNPAQARFPFDMVAMDLLQMPKSNDGNRYAMVVIDHFSRYAIVVPLPNKRATTVARALMERVILIHGHPATLLTDRGTEFLNKEMARICELIHTKKIFTTPYRPQADGMAERFNRTLLKLLRAFVDGEQTDWDVVLPYVLFAYNTSRSRMTGEAPYTIIFGREPPAPSYGDVLLSTGQVHTAADPTKWREEMQRYISDDVAQVIRERSDTKKAKERNARNDGRAAQEPIANGTVVMLTNKSKPVREQKPKLLKRQRGLYVVLERTGPVTYVIRRVAASSGKTRKVHADLIHPFRTGTGDVLSTNINDSMDDVVDDGETPTLTSHNADEEDGVAYEVAAVKGMRVNEGTLQFLIAWKGYEGQDSWEDELRLDCPELVDAFIDNASFRAYN